MPWKILSAIFLILTLFSAFSCSSTADETPERAVTRDALAGRRWTAAEIGGKPVDPAVSSFIQFNPDGKVDGSGGCNNFFGNYMLSNDKIRIGPIGATKRACIGARGEQEDRFFQALDQAEMAALIEDTLVLTSGKGEQLVRLEPN